MGATAVRKLAQLSPLGRQDAIICLRPQASPTLTPFGRSSTTYGHSATGAEAETWSKHMNRPLPADFIIDLTLPSTSSVYFYFCLPEKQK